jgi:hypothetical protein
MGTMFNPTDEQRKTVRAMSGFGVPHDDIATLLEIDPKTLRKHFRRELDRGSIEATAKVAQSLFNMATMEKNVAAAIFWMKARAGWREKHEVQVTARPLQDLPDAELDRLLHDELTQYVQQRLGIGSSEAEEAEDERPASQWRGARG